MLVLRALALVVSLASATLAQTTGIPGVNDLTVNGLFSGSTSCTGVTICTPATVTFGVTASPGTSVVLFASPGPCIAGWQTLSNLCSGTSIDISLVPEPLQLASGTTDATGSYSATFPLPELVSVTLSVQAALFDSCGLGLTQAYDLTLTSGAIACPE